MTQTCYKTWTDAESRVMLGTGSGQLSDLTAELHC